MAGGDAHQAQDSSAIDFKHVDNLQKSLVAVFLIEMVRANHPAIQSINQ